MLLQRGTPSDLVLRGFSQSDIFGFLNFDVGYHGNGVKKDIKGIDRFKYKVEYVKTNISDADIKAVLEEYSNGLQKELVLRHLGIAGENIVKLKVLFAELGYDAEFKDADKKQRLGTMRNGMVDKYGTDNAFKLQEFQDAAAQTREYKYGAKYTLCGESSLSEKARQTFLDKMQDEEFHDEVINKRKQTNLENYGVEHAAQSPEIQDKYKNTLRSHMLFNENSVEDLLLRGYGDVFIRHQTGISMRINKSNYLDKLKDIDRFYYCCKHVKQRFNSENVLNVLNAYGKNEFSTLGAKSALGITFKESDFTLSSILSAAGYGSEYCNAEVIRKESIQAQIESTNTLRYGGKTPMSSEYVKAKVKSSTFEKYGVDNASKSDEIKQKKAETLMSNYGVEYPLQSSEIRDRVRESIIEKYGVDNVSKSDEIKQKKSETTMLHYGVGNPLQSPEIRAKISESLKRNRALNINGIVYPFSIHSILEKAKKTCLDRYGVDNPFKLDSIQANIREYWMDTHGVSNPSQVLYIQELRKKTMLERFGVENPFANEDIKEKIKETNMDKYGVEYSSQCKEVRDKVVDTNMLRYGVPSYTQTDEYRKKSNITKHLNNTFNTSKPEILLYEMLALHFGKDDIVVQYSLDSRYPFNCDFYIKSRDLFIELNGTWTHGGHWFSNDISDNISSLTWLDKATTYYDNAYYNWVYSDVNKRKSAEDNNLNYVVFWDNDLDDATLWLAMGCPDGHDWKSEYSWLPNHDLDIKIHVPKELGSAKSFIAVAKSANYEEFYKNEISMWNNNTCLKYGTVHGKLYSNRYKYLGKLPDEITDIEILRGLSISKICGNHFTSFDAIPMLDAFRKYSTNSVYDPCAGWGERLTACGYAGISYLGCDINQNNHNGYRSIISNYKFKDVSTVCNDSSKYDATNNRHDTVFTCPPYGNREIYTTVGAENLSNEDFLKWWDDVVKLSVSNTTKYFMYQIDKKHSDDMNTVINNNGFEFIEEIVVGNDMLRHENRATGKTSKVNYESIQIFKIL